MSFDERCRRYAGEKYKEFRDIELDTLDLHESSEKTWIGLLEEVNKFAEQYPGCTLLCEFAEGGDWSGTARVRATRKETEEEYKKRFDGYATVFAEQDAQRRRQYEAMKKEFE